MTTLHLSVVVHLWKHHPLVRRLAGGAAWSLAGTVAAQGTAFLVSIPLARLFGAATFGRFGIIQSTLSLFALLAGPSLGLTATKYIAEWRDADPARASRLVGLTLLSSATLSCVVALALFLSSDALAFRSFGDATMGSVLRLAALCLLLQCYNGAQLGVLWGTQSFRSIFWVNCVRAAGTALLILGGAYVGGLNGSIWGLAATLALVALTSEIAITRSLRVAGLHRTFRHAWSERRELVAFSLPATLASLVAVPVTWAGAAYVARSDGGFVQLGYFNAANQWRVALLILPNIIAQPLLPLLCELYAARDVRRFLRFVRSNLAAVLGVTALPAIILSLFAPRLMDAYAMHGPDPATALRLVTVSAVFTALGAVVGSAIVSIGRAWQGLALNYLWSIGFVITLSASRPTAAGLGTAYLTSYALLFALTLYVLLKSFSHEQMAAEFDRASVEKRAAKPAASSSWT